MNNPTLVMRQWADEELGFLQDHEDWPVWRIAEELGRTEKAVYAKRHQLRNGWSPLKEQKPKWSKAEEEFILANPHMSPELLGKRLGRTPDGIEAHLMLMRRSGAAPKRKRINWSPNIVGDRKLLARTCNRCGLLLESKWFFSRPKNHHGDADRYSWKSCCTRCQDVTPNKDLERQKENRRKWVEAKQAVSLPGATNHGQPWTEADFEIISNPDLTVLEKALALKRTYKATQTACTAQGAVSKKMGLGDPFVEQWIIDNPNVCQVDLIAASLADPETEPASTAHPQWDWDEDVA